jgi:YHS domain-containing protein
MSFRIATATICLALGTLSFGGCASSHSAQSAGAVNCSNTSCPFSGEPVNTAYTSTYKDKTVGFCCPKCKAKFDAMSDSDKAKKVAMMK